MRRVEWRVLVAASIVLGGTALSLVGALLVASGQHARESRATARSIGFTAYEPRSLPPRFVLDSATAAAGRDSPAVRTA